jgi:sugar lactone lactonase YvrE
MVSLAGCVVDAGGLTHVDQQPDPEPARPPAVKPADPGSPRGGSPPAPAPPTAPADPAAAPTAAADAGAPSAVAAPDASPVPNPEPANPAPPSADAGTPPAPPAPPPMTPPPSAEACNAPVRGPVGYKRSVPASEDFTFDADGYLLVFGGRGLVRMSYEGEPDLVAMNVLSGREGGALLSTKGGDVLVADLQDDMIVRLDGNGVRRRVAPVQAPSRMIRGPGGKLYVTSLRGGIHRLDPDSGALTQVGRLDWDPSGIAFSPDYKTLYVTAFRAQALYTMKVRADGGLEPAQLWLRNVGNEPDGMTVDECGNLYVAIRGDRVVRRVTPGGRMEVIVDLERDRPSTVGFGSGKRGWDDHTLYVANVDRGGLYEVKLPVRAAPPPGE